MGLKNLYNSQTKTINAAALIVAGSALISRVLGLVRDRLLAGSFGAGSDLDVYFAAFRIPDLVYNILIAGGVVVAFLPLFSEYFLKDKEEAWKFANNVLNVFLFFLVLISFVFFLLAPILVKFITPGFSFSQLQLTVALTQILFLSPILLGLSSLFSGMLQYFDRFLAFSLSPVFYNLGIILGIVFLAPLFGIFGVVLGVILGALLHFLIQVPSVLQAGFAWRPVLNFRDPKIKRVFSLMLPRTLGVAAPQINLMVVTFIASTLPAGALTVFTFANNLQQFPLGLIGIPLALSAFPVLARSFAARNREEFLKGFYQTFRKIVYFSLPLSALIFIFRGQIIDLVLKTGRFDESSAGLASASLGLFALGIWASCLIPLVLRAFFALQDTRTPTVIAVLAMVLNIVLSFGFVRLLGSVLGLPLAFSVDSIIQLGLLMVLLPRKIKF